MPAHILEMAVACPEKATPPSNSSYAETKMPRDNNLLILLVDDDVQIADLLSSLLASAGFDSVVASNGQEAIGKFHQHDFNMVLLDLNLGPPPDGFGVLEAIKKARPDVPVIMMSGATTANVKEHAIQNGASAFLAKPFEPQRLLHLITASADRTESRKQ